MIVFNWDGEDPIGDGDAQQPIASRWVLVPSRRDWGGHFTSFPDSLYQLPGRIHWSPWALWGALDKSGVRAVVRDLRTAAEGGSGCYIFAVQAMDEAGAVTPVFDCQTPGKNNVALVLARDGIGAMLTVDDRFLGTYNFVSGTPPVQVDVAAGQPIRFKWRGDASSYGGEVAEFRYGWNIRNLANDEEWDQGWTQAARQAPVRAFGSGTQYFFLEARDNAETVTHAEFELTVHPVTRRRGLLFVDDTRNDTEPLAERQRWLAVIDLLRVQHPFAFDPTHDVYTPRDNGGNNYPPPIDLVFDYKAIVWSLYANNGSALGFLAHFVDPFVESSPGIQAPFNYLNIYLENHGKMWVSGFSPAVELWLKRYQKLPVNVTGWDDPEQPHPSVDSVGALSFLYKMGVETFDRGGGTYPVSWERLQMQHWCRGLRRAVSPGSRLQTFVAADALGHRHAVTRPDSDWAADVEALPPEGRVYTTDRSLAHTHTVLVTQEQFRRLQRGEKVTAVTSPAALPEPHTHMFEFVDQVGLWGAPPALEVDSGSWPQPRDLGVNRWRGRPNIEIYNMPEQMEREVKPLRASRSLTLYTYVSGDAPRSPTLRYPNTADGQPVFVLGKGEETEPNYTRAFCGFEPRLLTLRSHVALADFVLWRHFRLGEPEAP